MTENKLMTITRFIDDSYFSYFPERLCCITIETYALGLHVNKLKIVSLRFAVVRNCLSHFTPSNIYLNTLKRYIISFLKLR